MLDVAAIFDMDGVLIDSEPLWCRAEVEVFNNLGVPLKERIGFAADLVTLRGALGIIVILSTTIAVLAKTVLRAAPSENS